MRPPTYPLPRAVTSKLVSSGSAPRDRLYEVRHSDVDGSSASPTPVLSYIKAPRPAGDPDSWDPLLLKAVEKVCPSHLGGFGTSTGEVTSEGATIAVRCGGETVGNVLVTFTGVRTPNVCGLSLNLARDRLDLIGLSVGSVTRSKAITAEEDLVLEQSPRRGAVVAAGTEIDLVVAGG
jgi:hypothetical protein